MRLIKAFLMSLGMFSVLPVPKNIWNDRYMPLMIPNLPIAGLIIGFIWYAVTFFLHRPFFPPLIQSAIVMFAPMFLSGFLHVDGYMDTADSVFSRRDLEGKRKILKDSHVGAFAVIALACLFLFQFCAVSTILTLNKNISALIFIPVISRCVAGIALLDLKSISETGFASSFKAGTKNRHTIFICLFIIAGFTAAYYFCGLTVLLSLCIEGVVALCVTGYVYRQLNGISGDLCGCIIAVGELAGLLAFAIF